MKIKICLSSLGEKSCSGDPFDIFRGVGNWESLGLEHGLGLGLDHGLGLGFGSKHLIFFAVVGISWTDTVAPVAGQIELNAELRLSVQRVELSVDLYSLIL